MQVPPVQAPLIANPHPGMPASSIPFMAQWPTRKVVQPAVKERHFGKMVQLTFGGENAEAYVNVQGTQLTWQAKIPGFTDDQIFTMGLNGSHKRLISTGKGRCTCSYFTPNGRWIYFSSTHATEPNGQPPVDMSKGYVWEVNPHYAMYKEHPDGSGFAPLKDVHHYLAETTIAPNGKYMVWTSDKSGDLEIYRSNLTGGNEKRLTHQVGYDGGPFVSWDSKTVVYRRDDFKSQSEVTDYQELLKQHLIRPTRLEIWMMDAQGNHKRQITHLHCASFAPFLAPDNKHIIFSSNYGDPAGRNFQLFMIGTNGKGLEQITYDSRFNCFPMFTKDGKKLVFCSNRFNHSQYETNIFVVNWIK